MLKTALLLLLGLLAGTGAALVYNHLFGEGAELVEAQARNASDGGHLALEVQTNLQLKNEVDALSAQLKQALSRNQDLQGQIDQLAKTPPAADPANPIAQLLKEATPQPIATGQNPNPAETLASFETNQITPLLQLSDPQRDQVDKALYQIDLDLTDPAKLQALAAGASDPTAILEAQAEAKETALAQILTPAQQTQYHELLQSQLEMQKALLQKLIPAQP